MKPLKPTFLAASCALLACATFSLRASATSPSATCQLGMAPTSGHHVPSNAPALAYWDDSAPGYSMSFEGIAEQGAMKWSGPFNTGTPSSAPQKFEVREDTRLLGARLVLATPAWDSSWRYEIPLKTRCGDVAYPEGHTVFTEPTHALPSLIGTASAVANATNGTNITIKLSPELAAFVDLTLWEIVINGGVWAQVPYGKATRDEAGNLVLFVSSDGVFAGRPRTGAALCSNETTLTTKQFEVRAHVAGASADLDPTSIVVDAPFRCGPSGVIPGGPATTPPSGNGSGSGSGSGAGQQQPNANESSESGCTLSSSHSSSSAPPWATAALLGIVHAIMIRRRRRRHHV